MQRKNSTSKSVSFHKVNINRLVFISCVRKKEFSHGRVTTEILGKEKRAVMACLRFGLPELALVFSKLASSVTCTACFMCSYALASLCCTSVKLLLTETSADIKSSLSLSAQREHANEKWSNDHVFVSQERKGSTSWKKSLGGPAQHVVVKHVGERPSVPPPRGQGAGRAARKAGHSWQG